MKVVVNATPLIGLALINRLDLLPALFDEVVVPRAVYEEVIVQGFPHQSSGCILVRAGVGAGMTRTTRIQP